MRVAELAGEGLDEACDRFGFLGHASQCAVAGGWETGFLQGIVCRTGLTSRTSQIGWSRTGWSRIDTEPSLGQSEAMAKPALGRGLGALLGGNPIAKPPQAPASAPTPAQPAQRA